MWLWKQSNKKTTEEQGKVTGNDGIVNRYKLYKNKFWEKSHHLFACWNMLGQFHFGKISFADGFQ